MKAKWIILALAAGLLTNPAAHAKNDKVNEKSTKKTTTTRTTHENHRGGSETALERNKGQRGMEKGKGRRVRKGWEHSQHGGRKSTDR